MGTGLTSLPVHPSRLRTTSHQSLPSKTTRPAHGALVRPPTAISGLLLQPVPREPLLQAIGLVLHVLIGLGYHPVLHDFHAADLVLHLHLQVAPLSPKALARSVSMGGFFSRQS